MIDVNRARGFVLNTEWLTRSKEITASHLGAHSCLELESISKQMLGGPTAGLKDDKCK